MLFKTVSIPIDLDENVLLPFMEQCSRLYNEYIDWAWNNKTWNKTKAHYQLYKYFRSTYPNLPSSMIQSVRDVALEAVKRSKFKSKKPRAKKYSSIRYDQRTMTLRGSQLTFSCVGKRQKVILNIPEHFKQVVNNWKFKGGNICYQKGQFWVKLWFKTEEPQSYQNNNVLGIDLGLYNICVLSNGKIISAKQLRKQQRKYLYNRKKLQSKGTPSAKRKLKKLSGKEKRFSRDFNHCISKYIASLDYGTFAIENLKNIRNQSKKSKKLNKWISSWPFGQLKDFLIYKSKEQGKEVVQVDARYTSQKCSMCGHISKNNRNKSRFNCELCGFKFHSDINAAINIRDNFLLSSVNKLTDRQAEVKQPNVSTINNS